MNKEMTIVWHDLIEDPSDLPPSKSSVWSEEVYVQTRYGDRFNAAYYRGVNKEEGWYNKIFMTELNQNDIVAWTYIPKYHNREKRIDDLLMKLPIMVFHRIKEGDKTNEYPKPSHTVIIFRYDESEDSIVSTAGFYDINNSCWKVINRYSNPIISDVIGWSPFFKVNDNVSDSNKEKEEVTETIKDEIKENKKLTYPNYKTGYLSDVGSELYRKSIWNKFYNNDRVIMKPHIHNLMENPNDVPTKKSCDGVLIFAFSIPRNENIITFPGWYDETNGVWKRSCNDATVPKDMICGWADFQIYEKVAESKMFENVTLEVTCPRETSEKDEMADSDEKEDE